MQHESGWGEIPSIAAIICSYNRAAYLYKAIESLTNQTLPMEQYEIIIVDNGSTDGTEAMVKEKFSHVENIRYIFEPNHGLSRARNAGWRSSRAHFVAFLDSDAIARPDWLERIVDAFNSVKPTPGCIGGRIDAIWEAPRPPWLPDQLLINLSLVNFEHGPLVLPESVCLVGANMAFPLITLEELGGFATDLGMRKDIVLGMEENYLQYLIRENGWSCYYHPEILVSHYIQASRLTKSYFVQRNYADGVSWAIVWGKQHSSFIERLVLIARYSAALVLLPRSWASLLRTSDNPATFGYKCSSWETIGRVLGMLGVAK